MLLLPFWHVWVLVQITHTDYFTVIRFTPTAHKSLNMQIIPSIETKQKKAQSIINEARWHKQTGWYRWDTAAGNK